MLTDTQETAKNKTTKSKSRRRMARELALQGIYQWRVAGGTISFIEAQLIETKEFYRSDGKYFSILFKGVLSDVSTLEETIQPFLDRSLKELSPVEAIELARTYGGSDGYKYVNGVLDKLALKLRAVEISAQT